jgi:hypothetical protein
MEPTHRLQGGGWKPSGKWLGEAPTSSLRGHLQLWTEVTQNDLPQLFAVSALRAHCSMCNRLHRYGRTWTLSNSGVTWDFVPALQEHRVGCHLECLLFCQHDRWE